MRFLAEALKRWCGIDLTEETRLLNRYGAKDIDELWSMILMDRTGPEVITSNPYKIAVARVITTKRRIGVLNRKLREADAKAAYKKRRREELYAKSR
jgi:hypothetical protein